MTQQAKGFKSFLVIQKETTFGVKPTTGRALKLPIVNHSLNASQPFVPSNVLTGRRDATEPTLGNIDCAGDLTIGFHKELFPIIAQGLFGNPTTDLTFVIDANNNKMDFKENAGSELTATLTSGNYSIAEFETEIKTQLEAKGIGTYTVEFNRQTKKFTITATGLTSFQLLFNAGTNKFASVYDMLGFSTVADMIAGLTITSDVALHQILITADNNKINFTENGGSELTTTITAGTYILRDLLTEISSKMTTAGLYTYTWSYVQSTRKIVVTQTGVGATSLELLWSTGTNTAITAGHILGFDVTADDTLAQTYTANYLQNLYTNYIFKSNDTQPSYSIEHHQPDVGVYIFYTGIKFGQLSFIPQAEAGEVQLSISTMGKNGKKYTSAQLSTYDEIFDLSQWQNTNAIIKLDNAEYENKATSVALTLDLGMDGNTYTIGGFGTRGDLTEGLYNFTGTFTALFKEADIIDKADAETITPMEIEYEAFNRLSYDDPEKVSLKFPSIKFSRNYIAVEGPTGISLTNDFNAFYNQTEDTSIILTLTDSRCAKLF